MNDNAHLNVWKVTKLTVPLKGFFFRWRKSDDKLRFYLFLQNSALNLRISLHTELWERLQRNTHFPRNNRELFKNGRGGAAACFQEAARRKAPCGSAHFYVMHNQISRTSRVLGNSFTTEIKWD